MQDFASFDVFTDTLLVQPSEETAVGNYTISLLISADVLDFIEYAVKLNIKV